MIVKRPSLFPPFPQAHSTGEAERLFKKASGLELSYDPVLWSIQTRKLKGQPFSFEGRDYLLQIYRDLIREAYITKGRQTELTEYLVNWLLFNLWRFPGTIGLYIASRGSQTSKFSNLRVKDWAISQSQALQAIAPLKNHTATMLTLANGSKLYFHSAWEGYEEARSIPADFIAGDEIQSQEVDQLDVLRESMSHSPHKMMRLVGTGSDEETAWHKLWLAGTQFSWDKNAHAWIPSNPTAQAHSYHVSQDLVPWITKAEYEAKMRAATMRLAVTEIQGWWYHGAKKPITQAMVKACMNPGRHLLLPSEVDYSKGPVFFGVDWGGGEQAYTVPFFWQLVDKAPRFELIYLELIDEPDVAKQAERVSKLVDAYKPKRGVMDAGGGTYQVQALERRYGHLITKCIYLSRPEEPWKLDNVWDRNTAEVDRTFAIDNQISILNDKRVTYPSEDLEKVEFIVDHFTAIESKTATSRKGEHTTYVHDISQPDDALHAQLYAWVAWYLDMRRELRSGYAATGGSGR